MTPRSDPKSLVPHPDDFEAWCEHPVTRFVATAFEAQALEIRGKWFDASWTGGVADQALLIEYRARADALMTFVEASLQDYAKHVETK